MPIFRGLLLLLLLVSSGTASPLFAQSEAQSTTDILLFQSESGKKVGEIKPGQYIQAESIANAKFGYVEGQVVSVGDSTFVVRDIHSGANETVQIKRQNRIWKRSQRKFNALGSLLVYAGLVTTIFGAVMTLIFALAAAVNPTSILVYSFLLVTLLGGAGWLGGALIKRFLGRGIYPGLFNWKRVSGSGGEKK